MALPPDVAAELQRLERLVALERELARRREAAPLDYMRWLPAQLAFLRCASKRKLLRAGNQGQGKTTVGAAEAIHFALGTHPFQSTPDPPTYQWAICATEKQSRVVQKKVWDLVPKDAVLPGCYYDPKKGAFVGRYPRLLFRNGSWIEFITGGGDTTSLASATIHRVWFDEPPDSERVFNEAQKRVLRTHGWVAITMTPVNRPVDWLHERAQKGLIEDLHFDLRPEHLVLDDGSVMRLEDGTPMDAEWIEAIIAETSDMEVPVVIHGEWEFRLAGSYFDKVWDPARMVREAPRGTYEELLGIDFGDQPGKQIVLYIMVDEKGGAKGYPHIHVEDEYVDETGRHDNEDDADEVLRMLRRNQTEWAALKSVKADRAHKAGRGDQKSASDLQQAIADRLKLRFRSLRPQIHVAKRGKGRGGGSVRTRSRWLHGQMARGNFTVHPRCQRLLAAIPKFVPWVDDDNKDPVDALVYGIDDYIYRQQRGSGSSVGVW